MKALRRSKPAPLSSLRRIAHSISFCASGSPTVFCTAVASLTLPRRTRSIACLTSATSAAEVDALSATATEAGERRDTGRRRGRRQHRRCIASSRIEGSASSRIDGLSVAAAAGVTGEKLMVGRIAVGESVGFTGWAVTDATVNCGRGRGTGAGAAGLAAAGFAADLAAFCLPGLALALRVLGLGRRLRRPSGLALAWRLRFPWPSRAGPSGRALRRGFRPASRQAWPQTPTIRGRQRATATATEQPKSQR